MQSTNTRNSSIMKICTVTNNGESESSFGERTISLNGDEQRRLSDQITALNFRLRTSGSDYASDWHVAGDPTLLIMLSGVMEIELRGGESKQFKSGEMFIAQDFLGEGIQFDETKHGHRARVVNNEEVRVLHLKLDKR